MTWRPFSPCIDVLFGHSENACVGPFTTATAKEFYEARARNLSESGDSIYRYPRGRDPFLDIGRHVTFHEKPALHSEVHVNPYPLGKGPTMRKH